MQVCRHWGVPPAVGLHGCSSIQMLGVGEGHPHAALMALLPAGTSKAEGVCAAGRGPRNHDSGLVAVDSSLGSVETWVHLLHPFQAINT